MKNKLKIGQEIIIVTIGNNARYSLSWYNRKVTSIGRKWFTVEDYTEKFSLEDGRCDGKGYSPEWQAFLSVKDYSDAIKHPHLVADVSKGLKSLSIDQLENILLLIEQAKNE